VKLDTTYPRYYAIGVGALLAIRIWKAVAKRQAARAPGRVVMPGSRLG
jgi:hypothetical protein